LGDEAVMAQTRTVGIRSLLALAHLLLGPPCAGLVFISLHMAAGAQQILRSDVGGLLGPFALLVEYIQLTPIFYGPGFLPALTTGLLTASRVWRIGSCSWLWASTCGALASVALVGLPSLFLLPGATQSWKIGYPAATVLMLGFQAVLGFVGTIPVWIATSFLRRKLAARRMSGVLTPAVAA
jgi:hypothetical protein